MRMQITLEQRGIKRSLSAIKRAKVRENLLHEDRKALMVVQKPTKRYEIAEYHQEDFSTQEILRKLLTDITLTPMQGWKAVCVTSFALLQ